MPQSTPKKVPHKRQYRWANLNGKRKQPTFFDEEDRAEFGTVGLVWLPTMTQILLLLFMYFGEEVEWGTLLFSVVASAIAIYSIFYLKVAAWPHRKIGFERYSFAILLIVTVIVIFVAKLAMESL